MAAVALLLLFFAQTMTAATQTSLTSDEGPQLTSGYSYLVTGDPHLIAYDGHPPLAKVLNALPLALVPDLGSPADAPAWHSEDPYSLIWVTQQFFYPYRPLDRLVVAARVPVALWGVVLAALVYRWARDLFGPVAGLGALFLTTFDPNLLAHAGLATNDLPVTVATLASLFTFWRFLRRPTIRRALLAGLILGLAQGTKLNALLLLPTQALLALAYVARGRTLDSQLPLPSSRSRFTFYVRRCALLWLMAGLTLWASYGFELRTIELSAVPGWPIPVPAGTHLLLWERVARATGGGHPGFLMGEISTEGWWHYFPVAFAIKTPLPTLIALVAAGVAFALGWWHRLKGGRPQVATSRHITDELALGLFVVLYAGFTVVSRLNIGYRHLLPVLPLLYVSAARLFDRNLLSNRARWVAGGISGLLGLWLVVGTIATWPFHLVFFNELIGGPSQGYRYLVDSNTDWGQALKALRHHLERTRITHVRLSTFIEYQEAIRGYRIDFEPLPPLRDAPGVLPRRFDPPPGVYVISTTTLQGIFTADPGMYDWFRHREPDARIGHAMFLYHVTEPERPGQWMAQCLVPVAPLPPQAVTEGLGRDVRRVYFDCAQSWIVPEGGSSPGWYALTRDPTTADDPFVQAHLATTRLSFEQRRGGALPPFALYEAPATPVTPDIPPSAPTRVGDLTFLGHTVHNQPTNQLTNHPPPEIWTFWQVETPPTRPLSLMLHAIGPGGAPALVADGLGVPVENWQVGDVIIQRHQLTWPAGAPAGEYRLYTGAYWLDTLERWPVRTNGQSAGDSLSLPPLSVR